MPPAAPAGASVQAMSSPAGSPLSVLTLAAALCKIAMGLTMGYALILTL